MKLTRSPFIAVGLICLYFLPHAFGADTKNNGDGWEELQNWVQSLEKEDAGNAQQNENAPSTQRSLPDLTRSTKPSAPQNAAPVVPEKAVPRAQMPEPEPQKAEEVPAPQAETAPSSAPQSEQVQVVQPAIISAPPQSTEIPNMRAGAPQAPAAVNAEGGASPAKKPAKRSKGGKGGKKAEEKKPDNPFAEHFFMSPDQKIKNQTSEATGLVFTETTGPGGTPQYAVVTDFGGNIVKTQQIPGAQNLDQARKWVEDHLEVSNFEGVEVRKLTIPTTGKESMTRYWVGQKSFATPDKAFAEIAMIKTASEAKGIDFAKSVNEAQTYVREPTEQPPVEIPSPANFEKEQRLALKMFDALDVGEKMFGPFTGETSGEKITWQSFGETSWRSTNLSSYGYKQQVGFWTNRLVFKGIRAPLSTIDPFVESTVSMESDGVDYKDNMILWAGVEWRPFSTNPWLSNFRPYSLPLLEWIKNYRFFVMYGDRYNIKQEITGSYGYDLQFGAQIFYEWGIDLPAASEGKPETIPDFLRQYMWGEYFGNYYYSRTQFSAESNPNNIILNSNLLIGFRLPGIPLPENPINDELVLMPYMRFEHVNSLQFSFPYQNQYFIAAGIRWMPFRTYRFKENEWLSKVKLFGEYVGVGTVQHGKDTTEARNSIPWDLRFGVNVSSRRF